jgi:hypothetical protein
MTLGIIMTFDQKMCLVKFSSASNLGQYIGYTTITTFDKFVGNMTRKVAKDTMHDVLGCGTSRSVVNNYIRITRNVHKENVECRKERKTKNGSSSLGIFVLKKRSGIHVYNVKKVG